MIADVQKHRSKLIIYVAIKLIDTSLLSSVHTRVFVCQLKQTVASDTAALLCEQWFMYNDIIHKCLLL